MPITIGDGGNRVIRSITIGDGGTNRTIRAVWVGDGGNRLVFAALNLLGLDPFSAIAGPGTATATYTLTSGGLEQATGVANNTWLTVGVGSDYDVMMTNNSGTVPTGSALSTWLNLGTTRAWTVTRGSLGVNTSSNTVEIRSASSLVVLASVTVSFHAEVT
jgi:hypothetical protein